MNIMMIVAIVAIVAILSGAVAFLLAKLTRLSKGIAERDIRIQGLTKDVEYKQAEIESVKANLAERLDQAEQQYRANLEEMRRQNNETLKLQLESVRSQITAESEKVLKARQEEFSKKAQESFGNIAGDFSKNLTSMREAFEANKKAQTDTTAELRAQIGEAVKNLRDQTANVGEKADHIASALRGQNKMQGCWGETQLNNILLAEGLVEGRDFDKEEALRDELGILIHNEDTGKSMRPDFILHYPDNTDIVVDCKVSLNALSDYFESQTEDGRKDAALRNLKAVRTQVDNLSRKEYGSYLRRGRRCLDYTIMFVPNVNALILARQEDPHIISDAFRKNVLITSEETLMPFLRLVRTAWINFEQARNQEKIIDEARRMIERVALFCENYAAVGESLKKAVDTFHKGDVQLRESGKSILHSARAVEALGVKINKSLPPLVDDETSL